MLYTGKATDTAAMLYSPNAYQYLTFRVNDRLFVRVFGLRSQKEEILSDEDESWVDLETFNLKVQLQSRDDEIEKLELRIRQNDESFLVIGQS